MLKGNDSTEDNYVEACNTWDLEMSLKKDTTKN